MSALHLIIQAVKKAETLYETAVNISYPTHEIKIQASDVCDESVLTSWMGGDPMKAEEGRVLWKLSISPKITEFKKAIESKKKLLLKPLLRDGTRIYFYETDIGAFIDQIRELQTTFNNGIDEIANEYETIKSDFEDVLYDKLYRAIVRHRKNHEDIPNIEELVKGMITQYMKKFPKYDKIVTNTGVSFETPTPIKATIPTGLDDEQAEIFKQSLFSKVEQIASVMTNRYLDLEVDAATGHMSELVARAKTGAEIDLLDKVVDYELKNYDSVILLAEELAKKDDDSGDDMDKPLLLKSRRASRIALLDEDEQDIIKAIAASYGDRKTHTVASHRSIIKRCKKVREEITKSTELYQDYDIALDDFDLMLRNLNLFEELSGAWIEDYEAKQKRKKRKSTGKRGRPTKEETEAALAEIEIDESLTTDIDPAELKAQAADENTVEMPDIDIEGTVTIEPNKVSKETAKAPTTDELDELDELDLDIPDDEIG